MNKSFNYLFILSKLAGKGKSISIKPKIINIFKQEKLEKNLEIIETEHKTHAKEAAFSFAKKYEDNGVIFACGGDGTLNEVATAIYGTKSILGILPFGTGNDFFKNLGFKHASNKSINIILENILNFTVSPIDLIKINDDIGLNITSIGYDNIILKNIYSILNKFKWVGRYAYYIGTLKALFGKKSQNLEYTLKNTDGETIKGNGKYILTTISNGAYYGNGFNPTPMSKINDGIIDVCQVKDLTFNELFVLIPKYFKGTHIFHPKVKIHQVISGTFTSKEKNLLANTDGRLLNTSKISFKVLKNAINFAFFKI